MKLPNIKIEKTDSKAQYIKVISSNDELTTDICVCYNSMIRNKQGSLKTLKADVIANRIVTALKLLEEVEKLPKQITKIDLLTRLRAYIK